MYGWIFNVILLSASFLMSPRRRWPFLLALVGNVGWTFRAASLGHGDMAFLSCVFAMLSIRNFRRWGRANATP